MSLDPLKNLSELIKKFKPAQIAEPTTQQSSNTPAPEAPSSSENIWTMTKDNNGKKETVQPLVNKTPLSHFEDAQRFIEIAYDEEITEAEKQSIAEKVNRNAQDGQATLPEINRYKAENFDNTQVSDLAVIKATEKELVIKADDLEGKTKEEKREYIESLLIQNYQTQNGRQAKDTDKDGTAMDNDFGVAVSNMLIENNSMFEDLEEDPDKTPWESVADTIIFQTSLNGETKLNLQDLGISYTSNEQTNAENKVYTNYNNERYETSELSHIYSATDTMEVKDVDGTPTLTGADILANFEYETEGLTNQEKNALEKMILQQVAASNDWTEILESANGDLNAMKKMNFAAISEMNVGDTVITEDANVALKDEAPVTYEYITKTITDTVTDIQLKTVTDTQVKTVTNTITDTQLKTVTDTQLKTVTDTVTNTQVKTVTDTQVNTVTATKTNTVTDTVTNTQLKTVTDTQVNTVTKTVEGKPVTETVTNTQVKTVTDTVTNTQVKTVTDTQVNTVTNTQVKTVTDTVTNTQLKTVTDTVVNTVTDTQVKTVVNTVTDTQVKTVTDTVTNTVVNTVTDTVTCTANPTPNR